MSMYVHPGGEVDEEDDGLFTGDADTRPFTNTMETPATLSDTNDANSLRFVRAFAFI